MVVVLDSDRNTQVVSVSDPDADIVPHDGAAFTATWTRELPLKAVLETPQGIYHP